MLKTTLRVIGLVQPLAGCSAGGSSFPWPCPCLSLSIWLLSACAAAGRIFIYLSQCNGVRRELACGWFSEAMPLSHRRFAWVCESLGLHAAQTRLGQAQGQQAAQNRAPPSAAGNLWLEISPGHQNLGSCTKLAFPGWGPLTEIEILQFSP